MYQAFDVIGGSSGSAERVARLRAAFDALSIDGFIVPRADEHQGEYIPDSAARLGWITGFTGSAGVALILRDRAAIFVDGRYTVQVRAQVDTTLYDIESLVDTPLSEYLKERGARLRIGFDPWLHTIGEAKRLREAMVAAGGALVPLSSNPIDAIWADRPEPPKGRVWRHNERFAGRPAADKIAALQADLDKKDVSATVVTDPSSIAWVLNIRGSDVSHTPLPLSFAILPREGRPTLFIDPDKIRDAEVRTYLSGLCQLEAPAAFAGAVEEVAKNARILLDPALAAEQLREIVEGAGGAVVEGPDPARLPRAIKNETEIAGSRLAHQRDGAAMVDFLYWLDLQAPGSITEIGAVEALENARRASGEAAQMPLRDISFDTISGAGPNGAIVHYRVNRSTDRTLQAGELFLIDSGAQYEDGTTDITRTVAIGEPTAEMREKFTLVLKGMIALSLARFPKGTRGMDIDVLARIALWKAGCDYAHGTGHGIGSFLAVHEGPQSISKRGVTELEAGMIISNEPGYYREGAFGIRIENLILVKDREPVAGGDLPMHGFETLTLAPIDRRLIEVRLLTEEERGWLDAYHAWVRETLSPLLRPEVAEWLAGVTTPLERA
ncbi:aminopeptidase P family protein [Consotaella salsifontis]|uniref:Xaa-Pro aminopeptidase n=1 Tax=Consotaella salsifontis TaxID=1365950 RepID=A0A1T4M8L7_9HYPH|nr:aminopeptidase P family protein [Consotaella salsifontis]SJZ63235.1 Xaa-Pro aminopeptidase [Consotaella salsifontis]